MNRMKQVVMLGAITLLSVVVQFLSWSFASGNTARPLESNTGAEVIYAISSFPLSIVARRAFDAGFWPVTFFNGMLWAFAALVLSRSWLAYRHSSEASRQ